MTRDEMYQMYLEALDEMTAEASKHDFSPEGEKRLNSAMWKFNLYRDSLISFDAVQATSQALTIAQVFEALQDIGKTAYPSRGSVRRPSRRFDRE